MHCTVLYCAVLYGTVLHGIVLYCTVLYCTVLYCTVLTCTVLYCTTIQHLTVSTSISFHCLCDISVSFQLASPLGFHITHIPQGNLVYIFTCMRTPYDIQRTSGNICLHVFGEDDSFRLLLFALIGSALCTPTHSPTVIHGFRADAHSLTTKCCWRVVLRMVRPTSSRTNRRTQLPAHPPIHTHRPVPTRRLSKICSLTRIA